MAEKMKCEKLKYLKRDARQSNVHQQSLEAGPFYVAKIERYISDPQHAAQTGLDNTSKIDVHQLIITDLHHKLKVIVHPLLSAAIQKVELQEGSGITVKECSLHFDETDLTGSCILIIHDWSISPPSSDISLRLRDMSQIPWCPDCSAREKEDIPLSSSRGYFLDRWSSVEMQGDIWKTEGEIQTKPVSFTQQDIYKIKDIAKKWNDLRSINPPLIVRIRNRCRLLHYAKPNKSDKWPFQAHFSVCDDTGVCTMVLWNALCPSYYYRLPEDTVILIRRFTVKKSFYSSYKNLSSNDKTQHFDVDINLNSHHPVSDIQILSPTAVTWDLQLPTLEYNFVTRQQTGMLADDYICDITGCVGYIGRYERERITNKPGEDSGGFWVLRWLHLYDNSSKKPFVIQIFKAAETDVCEDVRPGCVLVCRHMRVVNNVGQITTSQIQREGYLTSTLNTKIHVIDSSTSDHLRLQPAVKDVLDWLPSQQCKELISSCKLGGYFTYPTLPAGLSQLQDISQDFKITSSDNWTDEISGLYYREHKRLFLQAVMLAIKLIPRRKTRTEQSSPVRRSQRKQRASLASEESPDKILPITSTELEVIVDPDQPTSSRLGETVSSDELHYSFPVLYNSDNWTLAKQWLSFTACQIDDKTSSQLIHHQDIQDHFIITWTGLNSQVALQTLWRPRLGGSHNAVPTVQDLLNKEHDSILSTTNSVMTTNETVTFMDTAKNCLGQRFLLVLDCYRSHDKTELVLNAAHHV